MIGDRVVEVLPGYLFCVEVWTDEMEWKLLKVQFHGFGGVSVGEVKKAIFEDYGYDLELYRMVDGEYGKEWRMCLDDGEVFKKCVNFKSIVRC